MPVPGLQTRSDFEQMFDPVELDTKGDRWGHRWRASQRFRLAMHLEIVQTIIDHNSELRALDIGCGQCDFLHMLNEAFPRFQLFGTDISQNVIDWNRGHYPIMTFQRSELPSVDFPPASFDLISTLSVLYYLTEPQQVRAIANIVKVLKPGGYLLASGPLDGGDRYFDEQRIIDLLQAHLTVRRIDYLHTSVHLLLEIPSLRIHANALLLDEIVRFDETEFSLWVSRHRLWLSRCVAMMRRSERTVKAARLILNGISSLTRWLLSRESLPRACSTVSKMFLGRKARTHIIVLARKATQ